MLLNRIPESILSVLLSIIVAVLLWRLDITAPAAAALAGILLELVLVTHRMLNRINYLGAQFGQIVKLPDLGQIIEHVITVNRNERRFAKVILKALLRNYCGQTSLLAQGRLNMSPEQFMVLARSVFEVLGRGDTILATSYLAGGEYWATNYGAQYAALNEMANGNGAKITRIYILRDQVHLSEKIDTIKMQSRFSDVRTILLDQVALADADQRDFLLVNDQLVAEFHFAGGTVITNIEVVIDPELADQFSNLMRKLFALSRAVV